MILVDHTASYYASTPTVLTFRAQIGPYHPAAIPSLLSFRAQRDRFLSAAFRSLLSFRAQRDRFLSAAFRSPFCHSAPNEQSCPRLQPAHTQENIPNARHNSSLTAPPPCFASRPLRLCN